MSQVSGSEATLLLPTLVGYCFTAFQAVSVSAEG